MINDIDGIQKELNNLIDFYLDKNLESLTYNKCFKKTLNMLDRAKREFGANLFFILMFGPLKAGKSTLTNLLARDYVSPTGFGIETTLRPSLIIKSRKKEYTIDIYEVVDAKDDKEDLFNKVMDVLRGIFDFQQIKSRIRKVSIPLTEQNVKNQLIRYLDIEPLITVLNVPGGDLVTEHIALIDMPGLDGIKSNWQDSVVHKWILKRADFLIFIQSSMAALNKATFEFLQDAYLGSKKPPLCLVQNVIDAKYWRSDESRQSDNEAQRRNAKEYISSLLGISEDLRSHAINLGKASDGMNLDNFSYLLEESGFIEFENSLKDILNKSRVHIQQENSVKGVLRAIRDCDLEFKNYKEELKEKYVDYDERIKELAKPRNSLDNVYKDIDRENVKTKLKEKLKEFAEEWNNSCHGSLDQLSEENITKDKLEKKIDKAVDEINNSRKEKYLKDSKYKEEVNKLVKECIKEDIFKELNDSLNALGINSYGKEICFMPQLDFIPFVPTSKISNRIKKVYGIGLLKKKDDQIRKNISDLCNEIKDECDEYADGMRKQIEFQISIKFDEWIQNLFGDISEYIDEQTEHKKQEIFQEKGKIEDTLAYIDQLELMCNRLEEFVNNSIL